ncbi:hypothetical protein ACLMAL_16905 [Nocardia sp. CWNU-33]|uniref:hypothetical protein n=1 Tax=Nocardia sp. CWNU-33 TaxID=3392117 RepID=UPI00398E946D
MTKVIKVFTPIKRVPTVIGKSTNGQKLPFGPYTLPQVAAAIVLLVVTSVFAMTFPVNPAVTFATGLIISIVIVFAIGLVPYTGVRMTSRALWMIRLIVMRKPVSASGMPINAESARNAVFVDESVVLVLPSRQSAIEASPGVLADARLLELVAAGSSGAGAASEGRN